MTNCGRRTILPIASVVSLMALVSPVFAGPANPDAPSLPAGLRRIIVDRQNTVLRPLPVESTVGAPSPWPSAATPNPPKSKGRRNGKRGAAPAAAMRGRKTPPTPALPPVLTATQKREMATIRLVKALEERREKDPKQTLAIVRQAIREGADPNAVDKNGVTPLVWILFDYQGGKAYDIDLVRLLIKQGANPDEVARVYGSGRPLMRAAANGWADAVQALLDGTQPARTDVVDADDRTALHFALIKGHNDIAKVLITAGSPLSTLDEDGRTPLHYAAISGNAELVKALLEAGTDDTIKDVDGHTALFLAITKGYSDSAVALIGSETAPLRDGDDYGNTPLHLAAKAGDLPMVQAFVAAYHKRLITVDERNREVCTPLYLASEAGHLDVVRELVQAGASIFEKGRGGLKPYDVARAKENVEVANFLRVAAGER